MATDFGSFFYPPGGSGAGTLAVATEADLPTTGVTPGEVATTIDTGIVYVWTGTIWNPQSGASAPTGPANTVAGFDGSGNLAQVPGSETDAFGQILFEGTGSVDGDHFTSMQVGNQISDPLTGGYEGFIVSPALSSTMAFQSAYNVEIDYAPTFRSSGGIGQYQEQSHMEELAQSNGYTSFNAIPIIDGQINGGASSFTAGAAYSHAVTGGVSAFNDFSHLTSTAISTYYQSAQFNPVLDAGSSIQNFVGFNTSGTLNGTISNGYVGVQISPQGTGAIAQARAISINLSNISVTDPQGPIALDTDSRISVNADTTLTAAQGFQIGNRVESLLNVASGSPVTGTDSLGNDLAGDLNAQDDVADGPTGGIVGWSGVGFISEMIVATGKTVATANIFLAGAALPTPFNVGDTDGGTITNLSMIKTAPPINEGGTIIITNLKAVNISGGFSSASSNAWGLFIEDLALNNYIGGNLAIGTTTTKVSNSSVGLELGSTTQALRLSNLTAAQETALTPLAGMILFNADTAVPDYYNGSAWVPISGGGGGGANQTLSNLTSPTAINQDLIAADGDPLNLRSADFSAPDTTPTQNILIKTGDLLDPSSTGTSGSIVLQLGASPANNFGTIDLNAEGGHINVSTMLPFGDGAANMGTVGTAMNALYAYIFQTNTGLFLTPANDGAVSFQLIPGASDPLGNAYETGLQNLNGGDKLLISTANHNGSAGASGDILITPGAVTNGPGGNLLLRGARTSGTGAQGTVVIVDTHLLSSLSSNSVPTIAAGANAGTGATASVASGSTDTAGSFTLNTGTVGLAAGAQATVTFNRPYANAPKVVISATNANAGVLIYVTKTTTTFVINFVAGGIISTTYTFDYHVIGN